MLFCIHDPVHHRYGSSFKRELETIRIGPVSETDLKSNPVTVLERLESGRLYPVAIEPDSNLVHELSKRTMGRPLNAYYERKITRHLHSLAG